MLMRWFRPLRGRGRLAALLFVVLAPTAGAQQLDPRYFDQPPTGQPVPPTQVPALASQLSIECRRLLDDVNYQLSGTPQGAQLMARGQAQLDAAQALAALAIQPGPGSAQFQTTLRQFDVAHRGVLGALNNPAGTAPAAARTMMRIGRLYQDLATATSFNGNGFGIPNPGGYPCDPTQLLRVTQEMGNDINTVQQALQRFAYQNPQYGPVSQDMGRLVGTVQNLQSSVASQAPFNLVQGLVGQVQNRTARLDPSLAGLPPDVAGPWNRYQRHLNRVLSLTQGQPDPGLPQVLPPPVRPPVLPGRPAPAFALIDDWVGRDDQFLAALTPNITRIPYGFQFQAEARILRDRLLRLRQELENNAPQGRVYRALDEVDRAYGDLARRTAVVSRGQMGPNIARIADMGPLNQQLQAMFPR